MRPREELERFHKFDRSLTGLEQAFNTRVVPFLRIGSNSQHIPMCEHLHKFVEMWKRFLQEEDRKRSL